MAWGLFGLLIGLTALPAVAGAERDRGPGPLPWRVGGKLGFTADAAAFPESSGTVLEVYLRIPPATLVDLVADTTKLARLKLSARLKSAYGELQHEAVQEFELVAGDTVGGFGKVVLLRFPARPGKARLQVRLEDVQSRRRGLAYLGRKVAVSNTVEGDIVVPGSEGGRVISDLEFTWNQPGARGGEPFRHGGTAVLPNPERLYGLYQNEVGVRFAARSGDSRPWHWKTRVLDGEQHAISEQESTLAAGPGIEPLLRVDVSREPAGGYDLEVQAWQEGDAKPLVRRSHFGVAWKSEAWVLNPRDLEDLVHFLLDPDQEDTFLALGPGEKERYLDEFWRKRDPTPETAVNEARAVFMQRVDYANATYTRIGLGKGMFSDMGRTYILYGAPSEVYHQVIPTGSETIEEIVNSLAQAETRSVGDVTGCISNLSGAKSPPSWAT